MIFQRPTHEKKSSDLDVEHLFVCFFFGWWRKKRLKQAGENTSFGKKKRGKTRPPNELTGCELSLLLFDPVPGDLLTIAQLDLLRVTNTTASFVCLVGVFFTFYIVLPWKMTKLPYCTCFFLLFTCTMENYHQTTISGYLGNILHFFQPPNIRKSKASKDLSSCACLSRILALYPYEPLPAILCHAPVVCKYPPHCILANLWNPPFYPSNSPFKFGGCFFHVPFGKLTFSHLKMDGKGRRSGFLLGRVSRLFSGAKLLDSFQGV